ncbi:hypothetical protein FB45DRAFT_139459 [Roridomyces roridus]|uniref:F-box domain-containing protein n=1 Tax=Roridomyces roridus TaxID=1738132 RepID=A0AAD7FFR3_9AGAR|nr:hypothetical protein FB45DRAFT_139459 [Roridomyces roridus]
MPPRKSRRLQTPEDNTECAEVAPSPPKARGPDPNASLALVQLPPELFDAIIEHFVTLPTTYYYDTSDIPDPQYFERTDALTALSQTCRALREITLHRLWAQLDICRVPPKYRASWYKYVMSAMERKANGMATSPVRHHVRSLTLIFSKSKPDAALAALWKMLPQLPNLRKIHVINLKTPGFAKSLTESNLDKFELSEVTTLFLPTEGSIFQKLCPNATHIRCVGGNGASLLSALTAKTERLDGMLDWTDLKVIQRLIKNAPNLKSLELRRPVNNGLGIESQRYAPVEWAQAIPKLAGLKKLAELTLTFPDSVEGPGDQASIDAARALMRITSGPFPVERRLVIRRVLAPHYVRPDVHQDCVHSSVVETF